VRNVLIAAALATALLAAGCGASAGPDSSHQNVFELYPQNGHFGGPAYIQRTLDLGFPPIHNNSSQTVRLRSVQLVSPGPYVQLLSATAYLWRQTQAADTTAAFGDLPKECPSQYVANPLKDAVTRPHSRSAWTVILTLRITRPGTYRVWRVKLNYWANGHPGWQYYDMYDIVYAQSGYGPHWKGCAAASG
jgi:hypothetical protein